MNNKKTPHTVRCYNHDKKNCSAPRLASAEPSAFAARQSAATARRRPAKPGCGAGITNLNNVGRTGVTLVEVVVAAFILILSLTALLLLFSRTTHNAEAAGRHLNALQVARTELEQLRSTTYSNITSYAPVLLTNSFFVPLEGNKQCSVVETNGYKEISMIISWKSSVGSQIVSQTFNTIICSTN